MVFSSTTFLFLFLPLVLVLHFARWDMGWRNGVLLVASLVFYAWGEGGLVLIMLASIGMNYELGKRIDAHGEGAARRSWLVVALVFNLGLLAWFKYANFLVDNANPLLETLALPTIILPDIHLPIGISFFTFQAISYVVDVYRREIPAQHSSYRLGLYIALFPQLIAGPIVRYTQIRESLSNRRIDQARLYLGVQRFIIGLSKKVLIADTLGWVADQVFAAPADALAMSTAWLGLSAYAFQIYYDFSGYSDMAIGLGLLLGFRFPENFMYPYTARSMREFWRRWHISLSTWFRDYLYLPLGGNRKSKVRTFFNLGLVFFLCGLWHGASWNFIIWGLFHGLFLMLERTSFGKWLALTPKVLQHLYLLLVVWIGWIFFRAEDIGHAADYLTATLGGAGDTRYQAGLYLNGEVIVAFGMALLFLGPVFPATVNLRFAKKPFFEILYLLTLALLFLWSLVTVLASTYQPFIYFRF